MYVYGGFYFFVYIIIYYKTPFVKERLLDPFGHNAENVSGDKKTGGYTDVTPKKGILFLNGDADIPAGGLDLAEAALGGSGNVLCARGGVGVEDL